MEYTISMDIQLLSSPSGILVKNLIVAYRIKIYTNCGNPIFIITSKDSASALCSGTEESSIQSNFMTDSTSIILTLGI
jgi:hypothetical protein